MTFTPSYAQIDSPDPVSPQDLATKHYIDLRTPTLPASLTSGSGVQSFTDALGDVWVAANGVRGGNWYRARDVLWCRVNRVAALTFSTTTQVAWDNIQWDAYGLLSGGNKFLPPVDGLWQLTAQFGWTATAVGQRVAIYLMNAGGVGIETDNTAAAATANQFVGPTTLLRSITGNATFNANGGFDVRIAGTASVALMVASANYCWATLNYLGTG